MSHVTMQEMLTAGLHFGHQTQRWNPKMKPYIFGARNKIYIINLDKTLPLFNKAYDFLADTATKGGTILFVGTKRQAQEIVKEEADRCGMYYINHRWLGGMLTNFQTIKKSVDRLKEIEGMIEDGSIQHYKKKEALMMEKDLVKLKQNLEGIKNMRGLPTALFIVDPKREKIAVDEATKLGIPVVAITDTNCDPDNINYPIPGNDDALRSIKLVSARLADAVMTGVEKCKEAKQAASDKDAEEKAQAKAAKKAAAAEKPSTPESEEASQA